jgi:hyperosmotically inducible periplasmic protein
MQGVLVVRGLFFFILRSNFMKAFTSSRLSISAISLVLVLGACAKQGEQSTTGQYLDDATVTAKVKADLMKDDAVKSTDIRVETTSGVVQLSGFVGSDVIRQRAEQLAHSVAGVKSVRNDLAIQAAAQTAGQYVDDATLTTKVKAALLADDEVKGLAISVETSGGKVQLTGTAKSDAERQKAEQLAKNIEGVTAVQNSIAIN